MRRANFALPIPNRRDFEGEVIPLDLTDALDQIGVCGAGPEKSAWRYFEHGARRM